ncbi:hypothetical protein ABEB36_007227 [Hypothenemus hampei]|uniref:C-type lectin domain-containing protein n=1 Tax=Hypothenemus hampei TaxID=57062 RepID=A0ABD1ETD1_HYPHA
MLRSLCFLVAATAAFADNDFQVDLSQSKYVLGTSKLTFMEAYVRCKHDGLTLAMERTSEETNELNAVIKSYSTLQSQPFFLGGFKITNPLFIEPQWLWYETFKPFNYTNWHPLTSNTSSCLVKQCNLGYACKWRTESCNSTYIYYICQALDSSD